MATVLREGKKGEGMSYPLAHERVVTLSADDLAMLLGAMSTLGQICRGGGMNGRWPAIRDGLLGEVDGAIEQLRGKFDL